MGNGKSKLSNGDGACKSKKWDFDRSSSHRIHMSDSGDFGSPNSTVVQNPGRLVSPPSVSNLRTGCSYVRYNPGLTDKSAEFLSLNSSVIQNTDIIGVQSSQNRKVLSDITNTSKSRVHCSTNIPRMCHANSGNIRTDGGIKKRVPFSTQNIDELYSIFSDGCLLKKRKSNMFEVPIIDLGYTPPSDSAFSSRGNKKRKQIRLENEVDIEIGAVNVQLSQNQNVLSDITNISHSHGQSSIACNQINDGHGNSDMIEKEVGANTYMSLDAHKNNVAERMNSFSKKRKSNLFGVPISVMDDRIGAGFENSERVKPKKKHRRLEHEVDIQFVRGITFQDDNRIEIPRSPRRKRVPKRIQGGGPVNINQHEDNGKETDSSNRASAIIRTEGFTSTPRRKRVPKRVQGGGPVNINQHEDNGKEIDSSNRASAIIRTEGFTSTPRRKRVPKRVQGGGPVNINQHEDNGKETDSSNRASTIIRTEGFTSTPRRKRVPKRVQGGGPVNINQHEDNGKETDSSNRASAIIRTEGFTSTPRRKRVPKRVQGGGPVNIYQHEDNGIWHFDQDEYKYDDFGKFASS
ncbi:hypothetical protein RIF29_34765 [Crotalaria pallida]|uniref:Uncharacterized protein n=1 Tax=Crotalaria pallida TaxID=3830 RepID=A0AAN9E9Q2_CROPI